MVDNHTPITDYNKKALLDQKALEDYVDNLIKEKNSPYVNDQNREKIKDELLKRLSDAINKKLIAKLSDKEVDELNALLDKNASDQAVSQFFQSKINDLSQLVTQVLIDFRKGYLSVIYKPKDKEERDINKEDDNNKAKTNQNLHETNQNLHETENRNNDKKDLSFLPPAPVVSPKDS